MRRIAIEDSFTSRGTVKTTFGTITAIAWTRRSLRIEHSGPDTLTLVDRHRRSMWTSLLERLGPVVPLGRALVPDADEARLTIVGHDDADGGSHYSVSGTVDAEVWEWVRGCFAKDS